MIIHRLYWLIAVLLGLILAACGDSDEPKPAPSPAETLAVVAPEATAEPVMPLAYLTTPCPVTIANGSTPPGVTKNTTDVNHGNGYLWTKLWPEGKVVLGPDGPGQILSSGAMSTKFPWWSTVQGALMIEGRRLDAPSFALGPRDVGDVGFDEYFRTTITFPSEGCWEVTGSVGDVSLNFVTLVVREEEEVAAPAPTPVAYITTPCPVTIPNGSMPPGETKRTAPVNYGNGEIWIALWTGGKVVFRPGRPGVVYSSGAMSMPFPWWSTARGNLTIQGRRLDAPSLFPMGPWDKGDVGDDGFFMRTITFPSEGCWEVTGSVGDASLTFVTLAVREDEEVAAPAATPIAYIPTPCQVTEPNGKRPPGTPFTPGQPSRYHRSGDMWTSLPSEGKLVFTRTGGVGKILSSGAMWAKKSWWRKDGETRLTGSQSLSIEGRRLDAPASPLRSGIPYYWDGVHVMTVLIFPTEGCWEVTGSVGNDSLTFVTLVVRGGTLTPTAQEPNFSDVLLLHRSADGGGTSIRQVDTYNGADVPGYAPIVPSDGGSFGSTGEISEDGSVAATIEFRGRVCSNYAGGGGCGSAGAVLHLVDLKSWNEVTALLPGTGVVQQVVFSPDARRIALSYLEREMLGRQETSTLMVFDVDTGAVVAGRALGFRPSLLEYSADGTALVAYGAAEGPILGISKPSPPRVALLDADTLEVKWERELADVVSGSWCVEKCKELYQYKVFVRWGPAVVLSKDRRRLYVVHADDERITIVDLNARSAIDIDMRFGRSWGERLLDLTAEVVLAGHADAGVVRTAALSFDEARLYVLTRESGGSGLLTVVDLETRRRSTRRETEATRIRIVLDGKFLVLDGRVESEFRTEILDADSLQNVANLVEWQVKAGRDLADRPIVLAQQLKAENTWFAVLDPETFEIDDGWVVVGAAAWWITP